MNKNYKVKVNPASFVPDYRALDQGIRRYIGRTFNSQTGEWDVDSTTVFEVPMSAEYRDHLKDGSLIEAK